MKLAFAGGGTGGHLFPGLAVAELADRDARVEDVVFFGAKRGIEARVVPARGFDLVAEPLEALAGRGLAGKARSLARLTGAAWRTRRAIRARRIDVVVGLGGYAAAAAVIGARLARVPVVLLEQNRDLGLANRLLSRLATVVCTSFEQTAAALPPGRARFTGNPVRPQIEAVTRATGADTLLVFGGSAGARSLNRAVVAALARLAAKRKLPPILHQTGKHDVAAVGEGYREARVQADVREFIDDMAAAYAGARLAICRAGATTVAELAVTGTPAVLVPYPHAAADHQTANARTLEAAGAAVVVKDDERLADNLARELSRLLDDRDQLDSMAQRAAALGRRGAAAAVLEVIIDVGARREASKA